MYRNNLVPIVMGARREEYAAVAPPHSFIHVDDFDSPSQLAEYLHLLDNNQHLYNRYFLWKETKGSSSIHCSGVGCVPWYMRHVATPGGWRMWRCGGEGRESVITKHTLIGGHPGIIN